MMNSLYSPAKYTITLGELVASGLINFSDKIWDFQSYNQEQRDRIYSKIKDRYFLAEISNTPIGAWAHVLRAELNKRAPKANMMYRILEASQNFTKGGEEHKLNRLVFSDFPQNQLSGNQDYATNANDFEEQIDRASTPIEMMQAMEGYFDPDEYLVYGVRACFIPILN